MTSFFFIAVIYMIKDSQEGAFVKHLNHACLYIWAHQSIWTSTF
jgi:hypothetical protein